MANEQNITEYNFRNMTAEQQREIASMGGKASAEAKKQRKTLAQIGDMIGSLEIKSPKNREIMKKAGIKDEDLINDVGMMFRLNLKAQSGDIRAAELLAKLRGQYKEQVSAEVSEIKPLVDLTNRKKNSE